jgi:glucose-6-phosphate isomerase
MMSRLIFDFNNMMAERTGGNGFTKTELAQLKDTMASAYCAVGSKHLGFRRLPKGQEALLGDIIATAKDIRESFDNFVVLGIGGSALGPIAVHQALSTGEEPVKLYVEDNVDPVRLKRVFGALDLEKTMFNVVTKSGKTSETMAQLMYVAGALKDAGLPMSSHVIATTDEKNGDLIRIAKTEGLKTFFIPSDVGGRFSELTPVGLLPAVVCGIDIRSLLEGAAYMDEVCMREKDNPALLFAMLHVLGMRKGFDVSVMLPYADSLKYMADWYAQLWAESLGKRYGRDGGEVYAGQTPVKALGVTDQHSQIQLFTEGPFDKIITFLKVGQFANDLSIPAAFDYIEDLQFLADKSFGQLLEAERSATEYALCKAGRPNLTITLPEVSAFTVGALLYFFEMATAYAGEMLDIDAFDQPGVEEGKKATFALMGKTGFEAKKAELDARPAKDQSMVIE